MNIPCLELIKFCLVVTYSITIEEFMRMTLENLKDSSEMSVASWKKTIKLQFVNKIAF